MIKKGIILAGGTGSRLKPLTLAVNKQLLPIYDKPMIFYPLSVLMLAGIKNILIISNKIDLNLYKKVLGNGESFGIKISYAIQERPSGLTEAFVIGEDFINNSPVALILGDNFFYGYSFSKILLKQKNLKEGARIFLYKVADPTKYGVAQIKNGKIKKIIEKPKNFVSNFAITGLYFFDGSVSKFSKKLKKSSRGEFEITDLIKTYSRKKKLNYHILGRGFTWLDSGDCEELFKTSNFVSVIEKRQGYKIACLEEIAFDKKWISKNDLLSRVKFYGKSSYSDYLKALAEK